MSVQNVVPEGVYTLAAGEREGLPVVAMLNMAYNDFDRCGEYPWLVSITIQIGEQSEVGLPTDEEAEVLNSAQDAIEAALGEVTQFHAIARQSWNGTRVLDYYVGCAGAAGTCLEGLAQSGSVPRTFTFSVDRDPEWSTWLPMLRSFD